MIFFDHNTSMKILVIDDHKLFIEGLKYVLQQLADDVTVLMAHSGTKALEIASQNEDLDLVLMDINMPDMNGFAGLQLFSRYHPTLPVVFLTGTDNAEDEARAKKLNAMGFIHKSTPSGIMLDSLHQVLQGNITFTDKKAQNNTGNYQHNTGQHVNTSIKLTPRQLDVIHMIVDGKTNKEIARELDTAETTIKTHVSAIFKLLNVNNRTQAAAVARKLNIYAIEDELQ